MPTATRWGALVAASLPLACSPAAAPAPAAPPAPAPVASAPPPRLSPVVDLLAGVPDEPGARQPSLEILEHSVPFGRGTLVHLTYLIDDDTPCPVESDEGCGTFSLRVGAAPAPALWPSPAPAPPAGTATRPGPLASPHEWVAFAGGRDAVYALRKGGKHIDRIDDQGEVTPFVSDDAIPAEWNSLWVIEHPGHMTLVGQRAQPTLAYARGDDPWRAVEVLAPGPDGVRRVGPAVELPMLDVAGGRFSAQGVRDITQQGRKAALAVPEVMALPDDGADKNRWALVWLELVAPPYRWPENRPQAGVPDRPRAPRAKRARHECGSVYGKSSRDIDDRSVAKHAHVTLLSGARLVSDTIAWSGSTVGPTDPGSGVHISVAALSLEPYLDGDRVVVPLPDQPRPAAPPPYRVTEGRSRVLASHHEELVSASFDPASREGLVVLRDRQQTWAARFDAQGRPRGEPQRLGLDLVAADPVRVEGKWMALGRNPTALHNLTDRAGPFVLTRSMNVDALHLAPGLLVQVDDGRLRVTPFGPEGVSGPGADVAAIPATFSALPRPLASLRGAPLIAFVDASAGGDGRGSHRLAWRSLAPGGGGDWQRVELPGVAGVAAHLVSLRSLADDVVATVEQDASEVMVWLGAGKAATRPLAGGPGARPGGAVQGGPVLGRGLRLPPAPGAPVEDEALRGVGRQCQRSIATGPGTIVLVCAHALDPSTPGLRVGLRTLAVGG